MQIYEPDYYHRFRCLAAACPDSCCKDWDVEVDGETAARYRALPGALGDTLRGALYTEDGHIYLRNTPAGRCPMWRADGLCRIQSELGAQAQAEVCRVFPRLTHDYGDFLERGLELSCPEAARLILTSPPAPPRVSTVPGGDAPEYSRDTMALLLRTRRALCDALPQISPQHVPAVLLLFGSDVQDALFGGEAPALNPARCLAAARTLAEPGGLSDLLAFYRGLEILTPAWRQRLDAPAPGAPWPNTFTALARYFLDRYYLQAVSDYDLLARMKFAAASCILIHALGGDPIETAQCYAKEIENDAENMDALLNAADTDPAFSIGRLCGLLPLSYY